MPAGVIFPAGVTLHESTATERSRHREIWLILPGLPMPGLPMPVSAPWPSCAGKALWGKSCNAQAVMSFICCATAAAPPRSREVDWRAISFAMSPSTFIFPAMNACIPA